MKKQYVSLLLTFFLFIVLSPVGHAAGLYTDDASLSVGNTFTVHYAVAERVENVGAVTLYISYDNSVLRATTVSAEVAKLASGNNISCITPKDDSSGTITASWTETECSMVLDPEQELVSITFEVLSETEGSQITSDIIIKGMSSANSIGNDDLSALAGETKSALTIKTVTTEMPTATTPDEEEEEAPNQTESDDASQDKDDEENSGDKKLLIPIVVFAAAVVLEILLVIGKRKRRT